MWKPWPTRMLWAIVFTTVAMLAFVVLDRAAPRQTAAAEPPSSVTQPFDSDPKHLWNRLHYRFQVPFPDRRASGPYDQVPLRAFDPNDHDATLWVRGSPTLRRIAPVLEGASYRDAISLLDEFLTKDGEKLVSDPLKRALLQHDLWPAFDYWVSNPPDSKVSVNERRELYVRLAKVMALLALTDEQIARLPDNYAAAVASKKYPAKFEPAGKEQPFLPADLWEPTGPWVLLGGRDRDPIARMHVENLQGRSTFAVFLRLPEGRAQTLKFIQEIRAYWQKLEKKHVLSGQDWADEPKVPLQTQLVLARRMMLLNDRGQITPSPLTESVLIRINDDQTFQKFRLRRQDLLAGKNGGLSAVDQEERNRGDFVSGRTECTSCHAREPRSFRRGYPLTMLADSTLKDQEEDTISWKHKHNPYSWGFLEGLSQSRK